MLKLRFLILFSFLTLSGFSQDKTIIRYFDSSWKPVIKDSAFFYSVFTKHDSVYNVTSYWMRNKALYCRSIYADTNFLKPQGLQLRYDEKGLLQDSVLFYNTGDLKDDYHFRSNGKIWTRSHKDINGKETTEGFDENGNIIKDFIVLKEAEFPGGSEAWINYIMENIKIRTATRKHAPAGNYEVRIRFIIDKDGSVTEVSPVSNCGFGMEEEVIRVIKKSPKWNPMICLGELHKAYREQPVHLQLQ